MKPGRTTLALAASLGGILLTAAAALIFQDNIARFIVQPRAPFQTVTPPPAPEYGARGAWLLWPENGAEPGLADIFYVHSTTFYSPGAWNAPIGDAEADEVLKVTAAPNEAGPFLGIGPIYGPRYRQATLFSFFTHKFDGRAARMFAYDDVHRAFKAFLDQSDGEKPIVLVGYGQGGLHVLGLLRDYFQTDEILRARLAAAYIIDQATPLLLFRKQLSKTPPCEGPRAVRCVVSFVDYETRFDDEISRTRKRSMSWGVDRDLEATINRPLLCTNPLTWTQTDDYVGADHHVGAASATGIRFGTTPPAASRAIGARCDRGVLVVDRPEPVFLRRVAWFGRKWRAQNYNLFYFDLAENARERAVALAAILEEEAKYLAPIGETVEIEASPINKVPKQ